MTKEKDIKVCVLGGSGFLGSHVCDCLSNRGYSVRIFDLNPSQWINQNQEMILGDILNEEDLNQAIEGCQIVYNFSGLASLDEGLDSPVSAATLNVVGNINALNACRRNTVERYVYASTVYVYSRAGGFYRCSKQAAEQFIEQYHESYGIPFTILRYGSLYGPRCQPTNGLYRIVSRALKEKSISYEGSSEAMREYIHVQDAAEASIVALDKEFKNKHVVLTGQEPMQVQDLLKMLAEILDFPDEIKFLETNTVGHYIRTPYAYLPRAGKKYIPPVHVDLGQGLLELIEYASTLENEE